MNNEPSKLVVFDLDSTVVDGEGIDTLAESAGVEEEVVEITERAMRGELDYGESLRERAAHLEGMSVEQMQEALDSLPLTRGAEELIGSVKDRVAIFSGGFIYIAEKVGRRVGADYVKANDLVAENGVLTGEVRGELVDRDKGEVLLDLIEEEGINREDVVAVGDGSNDVAMFEVAGYSVGFDPKPIAREAADESVNERDMTKIRPILEKRGVKINGTDI